MYGSALNHFDNQRPCNEEATQIANQMRYQIEAAMNQKFDLWEPTFYCTRYREGTDYRIKIKIGEVNRYIHVKIHKPENGGDLQLLTYVGGKVYHDPI